LRLLEFVRSYPQSEEVLQATQELINHILRFSTSFESVSARISSRESERARRRCLVCWILSEPQVVSRSASPFESWWLAGESSTLWLGVERRRRFCAGDVETSFLRGDGIEVIGDLAIALVASQEESRKRLGDRKIILLVSASTTWTRDGLVLTDTTG
jgi:hypothetical protein